MVAGVVDGDIEEAGDCSLGGGRIDGVVGR